MNIFFMLWTAAGVPWPPAVAWVAAAVGLWLLARRRYGVRYLLVQIAAVDLLLLSLITAAALALRLAGFGVVWQPLGASSTWIVLVTWLSGLALLGWLRERGPLPEKLEQWSDEHRLNLRGAAGLLALAGILLPAAMVISAPLWGTTPRLGSDPGWLLGMALAAPFYFEPFWRDLTSPKEKRVHA